MKVSKTSIDECGLIWNDPALNIHWPCSNPLLSEKTIDTSPC